MKESLGYQQSILISQQSIFGTISFILKRIKILFITTFLFIILATAYSWVHFFEKLVIPVSLYKYSSLGKEYVFLSSKSNIYRSKSDISQIIDFFNMLIKEGNKKENKLNISSMLLKGSDLGLSLVYYSDRATDNEVISLINLEIEKYNQRLVSSFCSEQNILDEVKKTKNYSLCADKLTEDIMSTKFNLVNFTSNILEQFQVKQNDFSYFPFEKLNVSIDADNFELVLNRNRFFGALSNLKRMTLLSDSKLQYFLKKYTAFDVQLNLLKLRLSSFEDSLFLPYLEIEKSELLKTNSLHFNTLPLFNKILYFLQDRRTIFSFIVSGLCGFIFSIILLFFLKAYAENKEAIKMFIKNL